MTAPNPRAATQVRNAYGLGTQDPAIDRGVLAPHGIVIPSNQVPVRAAARDREACRQLAAGALANGQKGGPDA